MRDQELNGLDGSNPLGFMAALGALRWLTQGPAPAARLSFREGTWRAVLHDVPSLEEWADAVAEDAKAWADRPHLTFSYMKKGEVAHDIKPPPGVFRDWLEAQRAAGDVEALAFAMGYAAELGRDTSSGEVVKPTTLHFTAGQQQFLGTVMEIAATLTGADVREALQGPWRYERAVKTLSWDATMSRSYALRASDPAKDKKLGNPGADWFAFQALPLFPVVSRGTIARTHCVGGKSWKFACFQWPLWATPCSLDTASSLLVLPDMHRWRPRERAVRGVSAVFRSDIGRTDQGGYGSFGPARLAGADD